MSGYEEARSRLLAHLNRRKRKMPKVYFIGRVLLHGEDHAFDHFAVHYIPIEFELWRVYPKEEPQYDQTIPLRPVVTLSADPDSETVPPAGGPTETPPGGG